MANAREMLDDVDNVGIMQGFMDEMEDDMEEEEGADEEYSAAKMLDRRPDSPEILMNNLRGDMRSVDARREELADLVGYAAASETPDSVLAMLQPVLAQQGGLGALPQSGPMAQGPQAPMMPPPPGPMAPPPPGAPPMPPEAMMPPPPQDGGIAALLAAGVPGGGQAPPQAPIGMRNGGYVQHFRTGSTEEAVTPVGEESASDDEESSLTSRDDNTLYRAAMSVPGNRELVNAFVMGQLLKGPKEIPSLEDATKARVPEYERLLMPDKNAAQAGMLFDLAGAALNYAANKGPGGEPLRGSALSRLAGALSALPGSIQKRVGELEKTQQQIKLLAIQAGEKERDRLFTLNQQVERQRNELLKSLASAQIRASGSVAKPFGGSLTGLTLGMFSSMAPEFAAGTLTPLEMRQFLEGLTAYMQPQEYIDQSGERAFREPPISALVTRALQKQGLSIVTDPTTRVRSIVGNTPEAFDKLLALGVSTDQAEVTPTGGPSRIQISPEGAAAPSGAGVGDVTVQGGRPLARGVDVSGVNAPPPLTLIESLPAFGLGPAIRRGLGKLPLNIAGTTFSGDISQNTNAKAIVENLRSKYTDASKILAAERKDVQNAIDLLPEVFSNPPEAFDRMATLHLNIERLRNDALNIARDPEQLRSRLDSPQLQTLNIKTREDYLQQVYKFQDMIDSLGINSRAPFVRTEEELNNALSRCRPGNRCFVTMRSPDKKRWELVDLNDPGE